MEFLTIRLLGSESCGRIPEDWSRWTFASSPPLSASQSVTKYDLNTKYDDQMMIICKLSATNMTRRLWWNVLPHNLLEGVTKAFVGPDMMELFLTHY